MTGDSFKGQFGGNRYTGHFDLARKPSMASRER